MGLVLVTLFFGMLMIAPIEDVAANPPAAT
jgi:hypothetical protein